MWRVRCTRCSGLSNVKNKEGGRYGPPWKPATPRPSRPVSQQSSRPSRPTSQRSPRAATCGMILSRLGDIETILAQYIAASIHRSFALRLIYPWEQGSIERARRRRRAAVPLTHTV
jgi:hypothetical protein